MKSAWRLFLSSGKFHSEGFSLQRSVRLGNAINNNVEVLFCFVLEHLVSQSKSRPTRRAATAALKTGKLENKRTPTLHRRGPASLLKLTGSPNAAPAVECFHVSVCCARCDLSRLQPAILSACAQYIQSIANRRQPRQRQTVCVRGLKASVSGRAANQDAPHLPSCNL